MDKSEKNRTKATGDQRQRSVLQSDDNLMIDEETGEVLGTHEKTTVVVGDTVVISTHRKTVPLRSYVIVSCPEVLTRIAVQPKSTTVVMLLLFSLCRYDLTVNETLRTLADKSSCSVDVVRTALVQLETSGVIKRTRRSEGSAYTIHLNPRVCYRGRGSSFDVSAAVFDEL